MYKGLLEKNLRFVYEQLRKEKRRNKMKRLLTICLVVAIRDSLLSIKRPHLSNMRNGVYWLNHLHGSIPF